MGYRTSLAIFAIVGLASLATLAGLAYGSPVASVQNDKDDDDDGQKGAKYEFGLIGDTRYTDEQKAKFLNLKAEMNREKLAFVVHDGDIKAGSSPCTDSIYHETRDLFNQFAAPFVYTPGDNEWTDCHRAGGDPLERLAFLRTVFFPDTRSLGQRKMVLTRQSAEYPENARWRHGKVTFATLHLVGSNNNLGRTPAADQEYAARNAANLDWLAKTFDAARTSNSSAVMLIIQANTFDESPANLTGFADTLAALEQETIAFGRPVVLVHGDSHYFRMDKPMLGTASGRRLENFTRVETFGTDDVHWLRVSVDPQYDQVFTVKQEIVEANLVDQTP